MLIGKALGYKALSLTDHETDGGWQEFRTTAEAEGIQTVVGAEFTGMEGSHWLHLTALDYDYNDPGIRALVRRLCDDMTEYTRKRFQPIPSSSQRGTDSSSCHTCSALMSGESSSMTRQKRASARGSITPSRVKRYLRYLFCNRLLYFPAYIAEIFTQDKKIIKSLYSCYIL